jgi:predicted metalloprotease with PDZ domain
VTVNAFQVEVPEGATKLEASFQFLSPTEGAHGRVLVTPDMLMLPWNTVVLYPAGHFARGIEIKARLTLPDGWELACALEQESRLQTVRFSDRTHYRSRSTLRRFDVRVRSETNSRQSEPL